MLDAFIIEELKRREREQRERESQRPQLEIPAPGGPLDDRERHRSERTDEKIKRGVVVIDLSA